MPIGQEQFEFLMGLIRSIVEVWLLWTGFRQRLIRRMPLFYAFIAFSLLQNVVLRTYRMFDEGGYPSFVLYSQMYYSSEYILYLLQMAILIWFYRMFRSRRDGPLWVGLVLFALTMSVVFALPFDLTRIGSLLVIIKIWLLTAQAVMLALVLFHVVSNQRMKIGFTHLAVLIGLSIEITIEYIFWGIYLSGFQTYSQITPWLGILPVCTWIFWFWTIRGYSPSVVVAKVSPDEQMRRSERFEKAVKLLLRKSSL
ncbi:MAG TPA: hypothetical protein VLV83_24655 [Acidobacteriota bacterium]|nr:hypothetical protein [Acidobacteriota bacterium]